MPAILMAAVCYLAGWINTMMSLDVERAIIFIQQGRTEQLKAIGESLKMTDYGQYLLSLT